MGNKNRRVDVDEISTWTKHKQRLCSKCRANCCTMPVEVKIPDLVRMGVITEFEANEPIKKLAKKLKCLYLDPTSRKCKIYKNRPDTCRDHPRIGSRPGFCAYEPK
jgi:Fe-S-cluster containining protein